MADSSYDKNQNTIDTNKYSSTILEESADAGQSYVDETLFLGDSNTARMYRIFNYCSYDNAIGSVGMSGKSLATYAACSSRATAATRRCRKRLPDAAPPRDSDLWHQRFKLQLQRFQLCQRLRQGIKAVQDAYPSVDIIVNAIPPLGSSIPTRT